MERPESARTLEALCSGTGATRRTQERLFKRETGTSLGAWRTLARLHHALSLLAEREPVGTVAEAVGYSSASAFVHAFRNHLGTTPGRFMVPRARSIDTG